MDDEPWITHVISQQLTLEGYQTDTTNDSSQVMGALSTTDYDLVVLDIHMPPPNGLVLLRQIQEQHPLLPVLMLTASRDAETATRAMHEGASDYIVKPHRRSQLAVRVQRAMERGQLLHERAKAHQLLERRVNEQTWQLREQSTQLAQMLERMTVTYQATLKALEATLDARDQSAPGHCRRVAKLTVQLAQRMGLPEDDLVALEHGARLHDIGKLAIPDGILMKAGPLTDTEWRTIQEHPEIGCQIVGHIDFLQDALPIIRHHHEHYDGSGYPSGLKDKEIPLLARIFSVVDAFDAQTNKRPYNSVLNAQNALEDLRVNGEKLFDPEVVDAFTNMIKEQDFDGQDDQGISDPTEQ